MPTMTKLGSCILAALAFFICTHESAAQASLDQQAIQQCRDHMPQHWLKAGDTWLTHVVTPPFLPIKKTISSRAAH